MSIRVLSQRHRLSQRRWHRLVRTGTSSTPQHYRSAGTNALRVVKYTLEPAIPLLDTAVWVDERLWRHCWSRHRRILDSPCSYDTEDGFTTPARVQYCIHSQVRQLRLIQLFTWRRGSCERLASAGVSPDISASPARELLQPWLLSDISVFVQLGRENTSRDELGLYFFSQSNLDN